MENWEEKQPEGEEAIIPETKPQRQLPYIILLCFLMFVLGGILVFAYFTFLRPEKVGLQPVISPAPTPELSPLPSPDITANWKTYLNSEYNYSLKYPPSYKEDMTLQNLSKDNPLWMQNTFFYTTQPSVGGGPEPWISVVVWKNDFDSLENWFSSHSTTETFDSEEISEDQIILYFGVSNSEAVEITGLDGFSFSSQTMNGPVERVIVAKDQYVYELSLWTNNNLRKDPEITENYHKILSTFRFID